MRTLLWIVIAPAVLHGQTAPRAKFEAASLHPVTSFAQGFPARRIAGGPGTSSPGLITYEEVSLKDLLFTAYRVQFFQFITPSWTDTAFFTVRARVPERASREDVPLMLQELLAERFALRLHRETVDKPGYALTVARGAPRLNVSQEIAAASTRRRFEVDRQGFAILPPGSTNLIALPGKDGITRLTAVRVGMEMLSGWLARQLQQPVANRTALSGAYDFHLAFASPDAPAPANLDPAAVPLASEPAPTLPRALERQLGLKTEAQRVPVEILIVDHLEKAPIEN